jgi:hypothetical protein
MDAKLLARVSRFAPPWVRYMFTLAEIARTGDGWVVASGEDIALWDTEAGSVMPLWPTQDLAAETVADDSDATAEAVGSGEIVERLLPFLADNEAAVCLFPNFDDDMLVEPAAVTEDLADFIAEPADVAEQLSSEPIVAEYDEWALLEAPEVEGAQDADPGPWVPREPAGARPSEERYAGSLAAAAGNGELWTLDDPAEEAVIGIVLDDRPALALFASRAESEAFAEHVDGDVVARSLRVAELLSSWSVVAYGGRWAVAISPDQEQATFVEPARFALDLAEATSQDA